MNELPDVPDTPASLMDDLEPVNVLAEDLAGVADAIRAFRDGLKGVPDKDWYVQTWFASWVNAVHHIHVEGDFDD